MKKEILLLGTLLFLTSCAQSSPQNTESTVKKDLKASATSSAESEKVMIPTMSDASSNTNTAKDTQDREIGLYSKKIGQVENLTDDQKTIIQYFDNDYFSIDDYDFRQRYPQIFRGAQVTQMIEINKIIEASDTNYTALASVFDSATYMAEDEEAYLKNKIIVNGIQPKNMRVVEGDVIHMFGRYINIENQTIDGNSYNLPVIDLYENSYINNESRFSPAFIKKVAKVIFGNNIEVRNAVEGQDYTGEAHSWKFGYDPYMICTLENSTNSKFTGFRFYTERGYIDDVKSASSEPMLDLFESSIERHVEFTQDLKHYIMFTFDRELKNLNIDYYDLDFNKIWNKEFENTSNTSFDFTSQKLYLSVNNDFHIMNLETGEDVVPQLYLGEKTRVSKLEDGIILISSSQNDTVMKIGLDGSLVWKTNASIIPDTVNCLQLVDNKIIISTNAGFITVDNETGELISEIQ